MTLDVADVCGGVISGGCGVVVGQPLSVVIVRMQTASLLYNHSTIQCMRQIYRTEGIPSFFRGLIPPLVSIGALHGILFGTYAASRRIMERSWQGEHMYTQIGVSGLVSGFVTSVFTTPVELLKNRAQARLTPEQALIELNPVTCAKHIVRTRGVSGLMLGFTATTLRDTPSMGLFFVTYEGLLDYWRVREHAPTDSMDVVTFAKLNLAGGIGSLVLVLLLADRVVAGMVSWITYPLDVVKSRIQTQSLERLQYAGIADCVRHIVRTEGRAGLFRGLAATIVQSFPVSAVTIAVYEVIVVFFNKGA